MKLTLEIVKTKAAEKGYWRLNTSIMKQESFEINFVKLRTDREKQKTNYNWSVMGIWQNLFQNVCNRAFQNKKPENIQTILKSYKKISIRKIETSP